MVQASGIISEQADIKPVSINITDANGNPVQLTVVTPDSTGNYTTTVTDLVVGNTYNFQAHVDADSQYTAADSTVVTFTPSLASRTITLTVG